jgi:hypothetical protein
MADKKPSLKVVGATPISGTSAPPSLGAAGRSLWSSVMNEYEIRDSGGLAMLTQICAALDRLGECAAAIERDGLMILTKAGPKEHPLLKTEVALRAFIVRTLQRLGLDVEPIKPLGRPGKGTGWIPPT